ncbi:MAG: DUF4157 domain-containing protein [Deltaproteobacteria bacterium]|nr:MAG: DUF4157 domain-containing protein [Deltaproteobacteria bacterium]TMQ10940.1 MAG: DUF4157 domain-containing protein [Deltaproteobacteria bacterium]
MSNALPNKGRHGLNGVGRGAATEGSAIGGLAPGKRTLTESLELAASASGHDAAATVPVQRKAYGSPALSASSVSAIAGSFASSGADVANQVGSSLPTVQRKSAADVAEGGFAGGGHDVPHRREMESSFGMGFGHVRAHSDSSAAKANDTLGSHAYAMGNQIAFKSASPSRALVAHELTHVVQQAQSPSFKSDGAIDTSGEAEANAVESAVAAGKPASSALRSVTPGSGPGLKATGTGPARRKRGPALEGGGTMFGMGMTFSLGSFEQSFEHTIWKGHRAIPIGIPGINFVFDPNVKVSGKGQLRWGSGSKAGMSAQLGVFGECGLGLSGGLANVAEIYSTLNPGIEGAFTLTKYDESSRTSSPDSASPDEGDAQPEGGGKDAPASTWSLVGAITVKAATKIGVSLGGGVLDKAFELGSIEICKLTGIYFDQTGFRSDKLGFEWSEAIKQAFDAIQKTIDKAQDMGTEAIQAARDAGGPIVHEVDDFRRWVMSW